MARRLAAILALDVVGYSRLIGADEAGTLEKLRALRKELAEPVLKRHRGRVVKLMGDGLLAEFASVVDAVEAAVEIQQAMPARSAHLPEDRRVAVRIGVNVGDVVVEGGDLFGDGVNIAARLQEVAEPNGIAISGDVNRQLRGKLELPFEDAGEKNLKNIDEPVHTWLWSPTVTQNEGPASETELSLPDKPSIAVLPFQNMSGDAEQEFFADGMTEDIITGLSRYRSLFVIARNSTFAYKGQSPDLREISRDLGVRYVLEGSIRKGGSRIRVTAQLIDGTTGSHIWAERYDRDLEDIFTVQDEITEAIVAAIGPEIDQVERDRAQRLPAAKLDAWECYQRGLWHLYRFNRDDNAEAQRLFRRAIEMAPNFSPANAALTHALYYSFMHDFPEDPYAALDEAYETGRTAIATDERDADAHYALGRVLYLKHDHAASVAELESAVAYNPNFAQGHLGLATARLFTGEWDKSVESTDRAIRQSPHDPLTWLFYTVRALAFFGDGRLEEAFDCSAQAVRQPTAAVSAYFTHASILGQLGREKESRKAMADVLRIKPDIDAVYIARIMAYRNPADLEFLVDGLRKAGMPA